MKDSVALIIIYNHPHPSNVPILEGIYRGRFSHVFHLMPFYQGDAPDGANVIPVFEQSFYFQGHIAQGFDRYFADEYRHYIFVADDLFLNPMINENNYRAYFGLDDEKSFLPFPNHLGEMKHFYHAAKIRHWDVGRLNMGELLPSYAEALGKFEKLGFSPKPIPLYKLHGSHYVSLSWRHLRMPKHLAVLLLAKIYVAVIRCISRTHTPAVPLLCGFSDVCIVSAKHIRRFANYCGVFAASNLFVEIALPTSLALCVEPGELVVEEDLPSQGVYPWGALPPKVSVERYRGSLKALMADFPECLYIHPIKLSQWRYRCGSAAHSEE